jgi:predicted transcriptional regulator
MSCTAEPDADSDSPGGQAPDVHLELTDPRVIRALTHPIRLALLEVLEAEGPLTATQAGELIGEPPNSCSFHFRQLAKYGFVEEAGQGPGHARPWRLSFQVVHFPDLSSKSDTAVAARALKGVVRERYFARLAAFEESRASYPAAWQEAAESYQGVVHLSPAELKAVFAEFVAILDRYRERSTDASLRPPDSLPVEVLTITYPRRPPAPADPAPADPDTAAGAP